MTDVFQRDRIEKALVGIDSVALMEEGFAAYSRGEVVVPPVGELVFEDPPGDVHIKYGYIRDDEHFVVKIASGFSRNPELGLPPYSGLMLVFDQRTGELEAVLLDEGHLTNVRTADAGAVVAKHLAPATVEAIGVLGTGVQARMQVERLRDVVDCREVVVWGRSPEKVDAYLREMTEAGWDVEAVADPADVAARSNLIVTATAATEPLLAADAVREGTHITAMGSDTHTKNELHPEILGRAERVVADSVSQCRERGEVAHALAAGVLSEDEVVELGDVIRGAAPGREGESDVTVADLTGVAVQDIQIAKAVYRALVS